jgi:hypothetical protein
MLNVLAVFMVIGAILAIVAIVFAANMVCQRYIGPFITGSSDPVAVALYCRPVK